MTDPESRDAALLSARGISKQFAGVEVLSDVDLDLMQRIQRDIDRVDVEFAADDVAHAAFGAALMVDLEHRRPPQSMTRTRGGVGAVSGRPSVMSATSCR